MKSVRPAFTMMDHKKKAKSSARKPGIKKMLWIYTFLLPIFTVFIMFYLLPIVTVFITSFTRWDGFNKPQFVGFHNFVNLFSQPSFRISMWNLLKWGVLAAVVHVGLGVLVAFILYKAPKGAKLVRIVYMIPSVISVAAWALIYKFIFNDQFGVINSAIRLFYKDFSVNWFYESPYAFWSVTFVWLFYAVTVTLVVLSDLMAIPKELHEAAHVDGAKEWQIATKINLPLCRHSIGTSVIVSITARIAMYEAIALTTRGGPGDDTMNISVILVNAITDMNYGFANAAALVMFLLGIIVLLVINRLFRMEESNW
ncbi:carbohydrate ABC transporter membrane protein 1 (CUT1 family) [Hungatella effluvii]|uniref:Carbohydrate ABC transporter membrane protein 1 (CUT1 family) n=1 Tax=Hungatella effluvii TaxID=1096246 RepID=A0A2V3XZN0_9FIRM|nr:carbohydrate ABC transporter membrane protein 1 (CUT1 family) [Hungatella effluvii]